jgi:hypothetical protein
MGNTGRRNRAKKLENSSHSLNLPPQDNPPLKPKESFILKLWRKFWGLIVGLGVVACIIAAWPVIKGWFQSETGKFKEATTISGELHFPELTRLKPDVKKTDNSKQTLRNEAFVSHIEDVKGIYIPGLDTMEHLFIWLGANTYIENVQDLYRGVNLFTPELRKKWNLNASFYIGAKDNRVYISDKVIDLQSGNLIAMIYFNKIEIEQANVVDPNFNDSMFEVKDKRGGVALSLKYERNSHLISVPRGRDTTYFDLLIIKGYFLGDTATLIAGSKIKFPDVDYPIIPMSQPDWRKMANYYIDSIPSIFDKPPAGP